jgi:xanthine dehydrogenase accessory factor
MNAGFWRQASCWWAEGLRTCLLIVTRAEGSTPGHPGFHMLVSAEGDQLGTVGGGIMERELLAQARSLAGTDVQPQLLRRTHREQAPPEERSGMICAGSQWILMLPLAPGAALGQLARQAAEGLGAFSVDAHGWSVTAEADGRQCFNGDAAWSWREPLGRRRRVFVIGGGHVGLALCQVLALTDFEVVCIDHRLEVATFRALPVPKHHCAYADMAPLLGGGRDSFAVVLTTAFVTDVEALHTLLTMTEPPGFIGLMGSTAKIRRIYAELVERGVPSERLAQVTAPVGLAIRSRTPIEIAISITAQLIDRVRAEP